MSVEQNNKAIAPLPIRVTTARWVLRGYVALAALGLISHLYVTRSGDVPINWVNVIFMGGVVAAGLVSLYWLKHSISMAMHFNSWVDMVCVWGMIMYALSVNSQEKFDIIFMFHANILALGLILGFGAALRYTMVLALFLLPISILYPHRLVDVITYVILAFALSLPARLVGTLIQESTTELTKINLHLSQEVVERKRAEEEVRRHRDHLEEMVAARTAELAASYKREQEKRQLSDTLREVAKIVSGTLEMETVLNLILGQLENVVTYHHARVALLTNNELTVVARRDETGSAIRWDKFSIEEYPLNEAVLNGGQPVLLPDVAQDERWRPVGDWAQIRSFINAPLMVKEQPIGILSVGRRDETPYTEDDAQTVFAFANQVAVALERARLHEYELGQVERELDIARQLQASLLPPEAPHVSGLDIAGWSSPARHVGGDFYSYFAFDQRRLGIAVGDVSGKGMQSALMMALSLGLLSTEVHRELAPAALLAALNRELYPHTQRSNLNTALIYLTLKPAGPAWEAQMGNAGLISPLVRRHDGATEWLSARGLPLGAMEDVRYREMTQLLRPGDVLVLSSDGVAEAVNEAGEMYGFDRLTECVSRLPYPASAKSTLEHILNSVHSFVGAAEAYDDLTLVVVALGEAALPPS